MHNCDQSTASSHVEAGVDSVPLLSNYIAENIIRSRRLVRRTPPHLSSAARFLRRASGRRMMLREPSVRVRENAAEQLEERQSNWAYSTPVIVLDILWNLAIVGVGSAVLGLSLQEKPSVPLRVWVIGYILQCIFHVVYVMVQFRQRRQARLAFDQNAQWDSSGDSSFESASDGEDYGLQHLPDDEPISVAKYLESANTMVSFVWWIIGFYWVTAGGQKLTQDAPQLYWLCVTFLAFDIMVVAICVAVACLIGIAVCCCLPCIIALLYLVTDQQGATKEDIEKLPKFKFRRLDEFEKVDGETQESSRGLITECDTDVPSEHVLSPEDAECSICLSAYDDGSELRELPCHHHFHCTCIDKWLHINAICPLCKYNILKSGSLQEEV